MIVNKGGFPKEEVKEEPGADGGEAPPPAEPEQPEADGKIEDPTLKEIVDGGKFFICKSNSEDIANISHLALTVSLLDLQPPKRDDPEKPLDGPAAGAPAGGAQAGK